MNLGYVCGDDARALFRILGEAREMQIAGQSPKIHVLEQIAAITSSQVAASMIAELTPGALRFIDVLDFGWATESDRARVYQYVQDSSPDADPLTEAILGAPDGLTTLSRRNVMSDAQWAKTPICNDVHRPSGIGDSLLSCEGKGGMKRAIVLKRAYREPPYGSRERDLLHLINAESGWLFDAPTRSPMLDGSKNLSPRERQTLELLLTGAPRKQISSELGVRPHTAHEYVKAVYRKLSVGSRAELMARAVKRARA